MSQIATERVEAAAAATADPAPLGLSAFALTVFAVSCWAAGLIPDSGGPRVGLALALGFGAPGLLIAGLMAMRAGSTFVGTAFLAYAGFWFSFAMIFVIPGVKGATAVSIGYYLLAWTIFTGFMLLCTLKTNVALIATFIVLLLTFIALTISFLAGGPAIAGGTGGTTSDTFVAIGGYLGIVLSILGVYVAMAGLLNLPVGARS